MIRSVSDIIFEAFWKNLSQKSIVKNETLQSLKTMYESGQITSKQRLTQLVQEMENRHAKDQKNKD